MVNEVLNSITQQLALIFGDSKKYYVEDVPQGLAKDCFTIDTIVPRERSKSPVLYDNTIPIVIHYFNGTKEYKKIGYTIAEQVIECLEYLPFGNTILRGEDISWQFVEDVLQIFITYRFTTKRIVETENMDDLVQNESKVKD